VFTISVLFQTALTLAKITYPKRLIEVDLPIARILAQESSK